MSETNIDELQARNRAWSERVRAQDPEFFSRLLAQQAPKYLWIGCSDSRVPSTQLFDLDPGTMFVHRNVANLVVHTDINCLAVLQYAIGVLGVEHVIVCGHYGCGGIRCAMESKQHGLIDNWLRHVKDIYDLHKRQLNLIPDANTREARLVELNVLHQLYNVCQDHHRAECLVERQEAGRPWLGLPARGRARARSGLPRQLVRGDRAHLSDGRAWRLSAAAAALRLDHGDVINRRQMCA